MTSNLKFRLLTIVAVILVCVYGIIGMPKSKAELIQNWKSNIRLGLDLSGGSHLVLEIHLQDAFKGEADAVIARLKDELGKAGDFVRRDESQRSADDRRRGEYSDQHFRRAGYARRAISGRS